MECLLFLELQQQTAKFNVNYGQDKSNGWVPPPEWGIGGSRKIPKQQPPA